MASYDFIDCSANAYKYVWHERVYILKLALWPVLAKFCCYIAVFGFGLEDAYLRQGLIIFPSYFVEGIFLGRVIQHAVTAGIDGQGRKAPYDFSFRDVMAAAVLYSLIKLVLAFGGGMLMEYGLRPGDDGGLEQSSPGVIFAAMAVLAFMLWGVRLLWLYVPLALGQKMTVFLRRVQGMVVSFEMIGMWLICFMPLAMILIFLAGFIGDALGHSEDAPSAVYRFLIIGLQSVMDIVASLLASVAMAFGVLQIIKPARKGRERGQ